MTYDEQTQQQIRDILEINRMIVKQNALLVQVLTMPKILVSGERHSAWTEYDDAKERPQ
jgi:hypothetical protein